jgi:hypothetical protein
LVLHKRGADGLRRCQEVAAVDALDFVERVGGQGRVKVLNGRCEQRLPA